MKTCACRLAAMIVLWSGAPTLSGCQSATTGRAEPLAFTVADADRWRVRLLDSTMQPLTGSLAAQFRPHVAAMLERLTDVQVIEMAMQAQDRQMGRYLASVAQTDVETSWAKVVQLTEQGQQAAAVAESKQLLRLMGEAELASLRGAKATGIADQGSQPTPGRDTVPATPAATSSSVEVSTEGGRRLHAKLLARHPELDPYYRDPSLWAVLSERPLVAIFVPKEDWASLSRDEKQALEAYAASCVEVVKASPLRYSNIPETAPLAPKVRANARRIRPDNWCILVGELMPGGRDMQADSVAPRTR